MNLIKIITSLRTALIWVDGHERSALVAYRRQVGEIIYHVGRA
jgi:hypothetical protein